MDGNTPGFSQSVTTFPNQTAGSDLPIADGVVVPGQPAAPVVAFNPNPSLAISTPATFGKISGVVNNPRLLQGALRFNW